ncbi:hypothetical protein H072_4575 [Dactylellina haptotyla CBS 200.50]|uniref:Uncharacterized protein n=1 Tax=Dactylellina haptotyla (strain CBS 200.50) TaxID=1284197 RepID=S8AK86_DACHA|nr:hypothetical protein H072_4575 [Dactylellina haptotyla CBS 200.50]
MASRPNLSQRKSTSSVVQLAKKDAEDGDVEPSTSAPKRHAKQFAVHSRHHRVPSGRNLKKLAGTRSHGDLVALAKVAAAAQQAQQAQQQAAAVNQGSKAHSTSPVPPWERIKEKEKEAARQQSGGHELKRRSKSNPKRSLSTPNANSKKANFEFASAPGSFDESADQLAQAELEDAMNQDAAKIAYLGGQSKPVTPTQAEVPDVARISQFEEPIPQTASDATLKFEDKRQPEPAPVLEHRKSASSSHIRFMPGPAKQAPATTSTSTLANGTATDATHSSNSAQTTKMNTPATSQPFLTPKSDTQLGKLPRPSPPFHTTNHPTIVPPQVSTITATTHNEGRRSMSSTSSGPTPLPVTSRFISMSSSPSGALSSPSSVRDTPMKKRRSSSFESPPTPHATPPTSDKAPITTLNHDAILRKPGSTNIGAGKPLPNRTQTKLLLQRQSSQAEWEQEKQLQQMNQFQNGQLYYHNSHSRRGSMNMEVNGTPAQLPREAIREVERINREYANVRRFVSPIGDSVVRLKGYMKNNKVPQNQGRRSLERDGSGPGSLGLSQSLGANAEGRRNEGLAKAMAGVSGGGSRDDSGVVGRREGGMDEAKIRELLIHVWNRDEPGGNNLSSSN